MLENTFDVAQTWCGTPCYLSPELCQNVPYSSKADVWVKSLCLSAETTPCYSKKKFFYYKKSFNVMLTEPVNR